VQAAVEKPVEKYIQTYQPLWQKHTSSETDAILAYEDKLQPTFDHLESLQQ